MELFAQSTPRFPQHETVDRFAPSTGENGTHRLTPEAKQWPQLLVCGKLGSVTFSVMHRLETDPMSGAFFEARAAMDQGEVPVGAVIVRDGKIVSRAGNQTLRDKDPTAHAEILAIRRACLAAKSERLSGCDIYVTLEPCAMCAAAISFARIRRLYFAAPDPKGGAVEHGPRFFAQPTCHHAPEIYGGIRENEAAGLLRSFFADRR